MCNIACIDFGKANISRKDVEGKRVIEVGARDVNGSLRSVIEQFSPAEYIGVDIHPGKGVDIICSAVDILDRFGKESFDLLICTEVLEHIEDWRRAISNFKQLLKPAGTLLLTTRSKGFYCHDIPYDFWRYETADMQAIFSDLQIEKIETDPLDPGIFLKARRPERFTENDLSDHKLYSVMKGGHTLRITKLHRYIFKVRRFLWLILPRPLKNTIRARKINLPWFQIEDFYR